MSLLLPSFRQHSAAHSQNLPGWEELQHLSWRAAACSDPLWRRKLLPCLGDPWRGTPMWHWSGCGGWSQTWSHQRQHCCTCSSFLTFHPTFQTALGNTRVYDQCRNYESFLGKNDSLVSHALTRFTFCVCKLFELVVPWERIQFGSPED